MDISEILGKTVDFEVEWRGHKVKFSAREDSLTPHLLSNIKAAEDYPKAIALVVTDWDVTGKDPNEKWPLTEDALSRLPIAFLSAMLDKIGESWSGEKKSATA